MHGIGEKRECRNISGLNWEHLQSPGFHFLCTSLQLCEVPSNKPFIFEETQLLDSSILSSLLRHLGLIFCGSKHPRLLLFLSHILFSQIPLCNMLSPTSKFAGIVIWVCLYKTCYKYKQLPCFLPSIFTLLCFPDTYILKSLVTLLSDTGKYRLLH